MNQDQAGGGELLVASSSGDEGEEEHFKPLAWGLVVRVFGYVRPARRKLVVLLVLTVIRAAQIPALVWVSSRVITGPIARGDYPGIVLGTLGYALLGGITDTMFHFRLRYALELGETAVNALRADVFAKLLRQPMAFFDRVKLGRIVSCVTSDVEAVRTGVQDVGFMTLVQLGQMGFAAAVMALCDWRLFLVIVAVAPVLWLVNTHFRMKFSRLTRESQGSFSRVTAALAESVNGIRVTQGFVREEKNAGLFRRHLVEYARYNNELARTAGIMAPLLDLNSQFFVAVLLLSGGWRVFHGSLSVENLILFVLMANQFFSPITVIGALYSQALMAMAGAERVFRLLDAAPDWEDAPGATDLADPRPAAGGATAAARVEFRGISFGYDPSRLVLHEVSFVAEPGQTVAIVGHTGSGKSSVINLLAKFYLPAAGALLVDGQEIRGITSASLHRQMGIVPQQNFLFSGTVMENVRLGRPEATEAEVRAAFAGLGCLDLIEALPGGLATEVGERGAGLSAGQRQIVCFARAVLADPRILILDEATSSIDALTDVRIQEALAKLLRGRTSFVVAHRLTTIRTADLVLVLKEGRVVERGTHAGLLACKGHYAALYRQLLQVGDAA
jgi:ATP-binding cassette subfamily B protein